MYRVRFNLENNGYRGWWEVKEFANDGVLLKSVKYYHPAKFCLSMWHTTTRVDKAKAKRIYEGKSSKVVCAWLDCRQLSVGDYTVERSKRDLRLRFNPHESIHWRLDNVNVAVPPVEVDNTELSNLYTYGTEIYMMR